MDGESRGTDLPRKQNSLKQLNLTQEKIKNGTKRKEREREEEGEGVGEHPTQQTVYYAAQKEPGFC